MDGAMNRMWLRLRRLWESARRPDPVDVQPGTAQRHSVDASPWNHPFLREANLRAFRSYSEAVWACAADEARNTDRPLRCAFVGNMAQNMHNWAKLSQAHGWQVELFPNAMDGSAVNAPEWEEFDGEFADLGNGPGFLERNPGITLKVPCSRVPMEGTAFLEAWQAFATGRRTPLLAMLARSPQLRPEVLVSHQGLYPYYALARRLAEHDISYAAGVPLGSYASGRPYCAFSVGADLMYDCGRGDDYGAVMTLAFGAARFLMVTNPHTLAHARRLGFVNPVYLPYPVDDATYSPGRGVARAEWDARYGPGVYLLSSARLDAGVKGQGREFFDAVVGLCARFPQARFVFLSWGNDAAAFAREVERAGRQDQILLLAPVGKRRLLDYYRSCDVVIDQFVYGYYGATALEAAAAGKPVVMRIRDEHYRPLYRGDVAPVENAASTAEFVERASALLSDGQRRSACGTAMRDWVVRTHGRERTVPILSSLLRLAAAQTALPADLVSPLAAPIGPDESEYHAGCRAAAADASTGA